MCGSRRFFSHDTFPEIRWNRDLLAGEPSSSIPSGFLSHEDILPGELLLVLSDLEALKISVQGPKSEHPSSFDIHRIQASLESRLVHIQGVARRFGAAAEAVRLAAYVCTYCVFTDIWDVRVPHKDLALLLIWSNFSKLLLT